MKISLFTFLLHTFFMLKSRKPNRNICDNGLIAVGSTKLVTQKYQCIIEYQGEYLINPTWESYLIII